MKKTISGLIGKNIGYSYSKQIHNYLGDSSYNIFSKDEKDVIEMLKTGNLNHLNITIPYKEIAYKYADIISDNVKLTGSCNALYKKDDFIMADNTDLFGFKKLLEFHNIDLNNKHILILGSGGSSKTILHALEDYNYSSLEIVSRYPKGKYISYIEGKNRKDTEIIINTTPAQKPLEIDSFNNLNTIIDLKYNPLNSDLLIDAKSMGSKAISGLYMLIAQAYESQRLFNNIKFSDKDIRSLYNKILIEESNIILIGMPGSGKTTVGKLLSNKLKLNFIDIDSEIKNKTGMNPEEIIRSKGENYFRDIEETVISEITQSKGNIISTGGGSLKIDENIRNLIRNGIIMYLKRDLDKLETDNRPLSTNLRNLYEERKSTYIKYADYIVNNNENMEDTIDEICNIVSSTS